jgi:hypothetical protein
MRYVHEADIRWLLDGSAAAALGMKSAHASFVARLEGSAGNAATDDTDIQDRLCEAAAKERRIRDVYDRCSHRAQRVLAAWARPDKRSAYWKDLTHVLPLCAEYSAEKHGKIDGSLALRMSLGNASVEQKSAALELRRAGERAVSEAMAEYEELAKARAA